MSELFRDSCESDADDLPLADTEAIRSLLRSIATDGAIATAESAKKLQEQHKSGHKLTLFMSPAVLTPAGLRAYGQLAALCLVSERSELIANCPEHSREHDAAAWADGEWRAALHELIESGALNATRGASLDCPTECGDDELVAHLARYGKEQ